MSKGNKVPANNMPVSLTRVIDGTKVLFKKLTQEAKAARPVGAPTFEKLKGQIADQIKSIRKDDNKGWQRDRAARLFTAFHKAISEEISSEEMNTILSSIDQALNNQAVDEEMVNTGINEGCTPGKLSKSTASKAQLPRTGSQSGSFVAVPKSVELGHDNLNNTNGSVAGENTDNQSRTFSASNLVTESSYDRRGKYFFIKNADGEARSDLEQLSKNNVEQFISNRVRMNTADNNLNEVCLSLLLRNGLSLMPSSGKREWTRDNRWQDLLAHEDLGVFLTFKLGEDTYKTTIFRGSKSAVRTNIRGNIILEKQDDHEKKSYSPIEITEDFTQAVFAELEKYLTSIKNLKAKGYRYDSTVGNLAEGRQAILNSRIENLGNDLDIGRWLLNQSLTENANTLGGRKGSGNEVQQESDNSGVARASNLRKTATVTKLVATENVWGVGRTKLKRLENSSKKLKDLTNPNDIKEFLYNTIDLKQYSGSSDFFTALLLKNISYLKVASKSGVNASWIKSASARNSFDRITSNVSVGGTVYQVLVHANPNPIEDSRNGDIEIRQGDTPVIVDRTFASALFKELYKVKADYENQLKKKSDSSKQTIFAELGKNLAEAERYLKLPDVEIALKKGTEISALADNPMAANSFYQNDRRGDDNLEEYPLVEGSDDDSEDAVQVDKDSSRLTDLAKLSERKGSLRIHGNQVEVDNKANGYLIPLMVSSNPDETIVVSNTEAAFHYLDFVRDIDPTKVFYYKAIENGKLYPTAVAAVREDNQEKKIPFRNVLDIEGMTFLGCAATRGDKDALEAVEYLINNKHVDVNSTAKQFVNSQGVLIQQTALDVAIEKGNKDIQKYLESIGARRSENNNKVTEPSQPPAGQKRRVDVSAQSAGDVERVQDSVKEVDELFLENEMNKAVKNKNFAEVKAVINSSFSLFPKKAVISRVSTIGIVIEILSSEMVIEHEDDEAKYQTFIENIAEILKNNGKILLEEVGKVTTSIIQKWEGLSDNERDPKLNNLNWIIDLANYIYEQSQAEELLEAIRADNLNEVERAVKKGWGVNAEVQDGDRNTTLIKEAAIGGHSEIMRFLIEQGGGEGAAEAIFLIDQRIKVSLELEKKQANGTLSNPSFDHSQTKAKYIETMLAIKKSLEEMGKFEEVVALLPERLTQATEGILGIYANLNVSEVSDKNSSGVYPTPERFSPGSRNIFAGYSTIASRAPKTANRANESGNQSNLQDRVFNNGVGTPIVKGANLEGGTLPHGEEDGQDDAEVSLNVLRKRYREESFSSIEKESDNELDNSFSSDSEDDDQEEDIPVRVGNNSSRSKHGSRNGIASTSTSNSLPISDVQPEGEEYPISHFDSQNESSDEEEESIDFGEGDTLDSFAKSPEAATISSTKANSIPRSLRITSPRVSVGELPKFGPEAVKTATPVNSSLNTSNGSAIVVPQPVLSDVPNIGQQVYNSVVPVVSRTNSPLISSPKVRAASAAPVPVVQPQSPTHNFNNSALVTTGNGAGIVSGMNIAADSPLALAQGPTVDVPVYKQGDNIKYAYDGEIFDVIKGSPLHETFSNVKFDANKNNSGSAVESTTFTIDAELAKQLLGMAVSSAQSSPTRSKKNMLTEGANIGSELLASSQSPIVATPILPTQVTAEEVAKGPAQSRADNSPKQQQSSSPAATSIPRSLRVQSPNIPVGELPKFGPEALKIATPPNSSAIVVPQPVLSDVSNIGLQVYNSIIPAIFPAQVTVEETVKASLSNIVPSIPQSVIGGNILSPASGQGGESLKLWPEAPLVAPAADLPLNNNNSLLTEMAEALLQGFVITQPLKSSTPPRANSPLNTASNLQPNIAVVPAVQTKSADHSALVTTGNGAGITSADSSLVRAQGAATTVNATLYKAGDIFTYSSGTKSLSVDPSSPLHKVFSKAMSVAKGNNIGSQIVAHGEIEGITVPVDTGLEEQFFKMLVNSAQSSPTKSDQLQGQGFSLQSLTDKVSTEEEVSPVRDSKVSNSVNYSEQPPITIIPSIPLNMSGSKIPFPASGQGGESLKLWPEAPLVAPAADLPLNNNNSLLTEMAEALLQGVVITQPLKSSTPPRANSSLNTASNLQPNIAVVLAAQSQPPVHESSNALAMTTSQSRVVTATLSEEARRIVYSSSSGMKIYADRGSEMYQQLHKMQKMLSEANKNNDHQENNDHQGLQIAVKTDEQNVLNLTMSEETEKTIKRIVDSIAHSYSSPTVSGPNHALDHAVLPNSPYLGGPLFSSPVPDADSRFYTTRPEAKVIPVQDRKRKYSEQENYSDVSDDEDDDKSSEYSDMSDDENVVEKSGEKSEKKHEQFLQSVDRANDPSNENMKDLRKALIENEEKINVGPEAKCRSDKRFNWVEIGSAKVIVDSTSGQFFYRVDGQKKQDPTPEEVKVFAEFLGVGDEYQAIQNSKVISKAWLKKREERGFKRTLSREEREEETESKKKFFWEKNDKIVPVKIADNLTSEEVPSTKTKDPTAVKIVETSLYKPVYIAEDSIWRKSASGRGNDLKVVKNVYGVAGDYSEKQAIEKTILDIIYKVAADQSLTLEQVSKIIKSARVKGGINNKWEEEEKKYSPNNAEEHESEDNFRIAKKFSKKFQEECKACGILSGRGTSNVGLRTSFIPVTVTNEIEANLSSETVEVAAESIKNLKERKAARDSAVNKSVDYVRQ